MRARVSALPLLALSAALSGCQWGSGNVSTGPLYNTKVFVGCEGASSGTAASSEGSTELGGDAALTSQQLAANAGAIFARGLAARDVCHGNATIDPDTLPEEGKEPDSEE